MRFHRAFEDEANVYLLLQQWGCGATLAHAVAARGQLPEHEAAAHSAALLDALAHLHARGVAHRDVKPANCLLRRQEPAAALPEGHPSCVGLADLGLATRCGTGVPARRGLCGTPNYLAPEALAPGPAARHGREADVWALGCLTHTLLVGHPPCASLPHIASQHASLHLTPMPPSQSWPPTWLARMHASRLGICVCRHTCRLRRRTSSALRCAWTLRSGPARRSCCSTRSSPHMQPCRRPPLTPPPPPMRLPMRLLRLRRRSRCLLRATAARLRAARLRAGRRAVWPRAAAPG